MAVTPEALSSFVNAVPSEDEFVAGCLAEAEAMVDGFIGSTAAELIDAEEPPLGPFKVPYGIRDKCVLQTAANLYYQKQAKNGIVGFDSVDATPVRVARDPMLDSYPLLRRFIPVGLA